MQSGVVSGYPVVDLRVTLVDGSSHAVDSSEIAYKIAGSQGLQKAVRAASPILLEPIMRLRVVTPEDFTGSVVGNVTKRRGVVQGMEMNAGSQVVTAEVPLSEMFGYTTTLAPPHTGRASNHPLKFVHYSEVPPSIAEEIIAKHGGKGTSGD